MIVRVLGSAAGGGVPQWNCACGNCSAVRRGLAPARTQSTFAVSANGNDWILVNCSPDIADQIERFTPLQPNAARGTPICGMLFTDANVDHMGGLAVLRQSGPHRFIVRSSGVTRDVANTQPAFEPFMHSPHVWVEAPLDSPCTAVDTSDPIGNELRAIALPVPGATPGYDGRREVRGAVVAYAITHRGRTALFAPVFSEIDDRLKDAISNADAAFLDGTFFTGDEMASHGLPEKSARRLGHAPVGGPDGTLAILGTNARRVIFTHVNNTNPMIDPQSAAAEQVRRAGASIAFDGLELTLA